MEKQQIFILLSVILVACTTKTVTTLAPVPTATEISEKASDGIEFYFSDPADPNVGSYRGGPDDGLVEAIRNAESSVDAAI